MEEREIIKNEELQNERILWNEKIIELENENRLLKGQLAFSSALVSMLTSIFAIIAILKTQG